MRSSFQKAASTCVMLLLFFVHIPNARADAVSPSFSSMETLRLGERMYREGILPSGEAIQAFVKGDLPVPGTAFSCVSCHLRSGLGSIEGGVFTPPTTGLQLFQPFKLQFKGLEQKYYPLHDRRPAYDESSLADVIRSGATLSNGTLNDIMPRYMLEDADMTILSAYLKSLSAKLSPGVSDSTIRFATIITDEVSPEERNAMLAPLQKYVGIKNNQANSYKSSAGKRSRQMAENMLVSKELSTRQFTLSIWILKGPQDTWRGQLEEHYRSEPVFALLGGITRGDWQVIHQFSEDYKIPCLLPQTDFPVISSSDWYTLYPSKGYYQEGETAAHYLSGMNDGKNGGNIIQIVRDSREGIALSNGFNQTLRDMEQLSARTVLLKTEEKITGDFLKLLLEKEKPETIILWDGTDTPHVLELLSSFQNRPARVFVSARYLENNLHNIPEKARDFTYITYPYSFAKAATPSTMGGNVLIEDENRWNVSLSSLPDHSRLQIAGHVSDTITQLVTMALMDMSGNYFRDNFFDVIGMLPDQPSQAYARLSFGPGQRYASKGCYIVQLTKGADPELVRKSSWVIH
jgi:hypothetical protein